MSFFFFSFVNDCWWLSFTSEKKKNDTELSKYLWQLKEKKEFTITWKVIEKARAYTNISMRCNLCIAEKCFIICKPEMATSNRRNWTLINMQAPKKIYS